MENSTGPKTVIGVYAMKNGPVASTSKLADKYPEPLLSQYKDLLSRTASKDESVKAAARAELKSKPESERRKFMQFVQDYKTAKQDLDAAKARLAEQQAEMKRLQSGVDECDARLAALNVEKDKVLEFHAQQLVSGANSNGRTPAATATGSGSRMTKRA